MITKRSEFYVSITSEDNRLRFVLGKPGKSCLLAVGLNPSSADEKLLDPTTRIIERIAENHGYDGWYIINLYPVRCAKPSDLPRRKSVEYFSQNIRCIDAFLQENMGSIGKICLGWGNHVGKLSYLQKSAIEIRGLLINYTSEFCCIGITKDGNPIHPSPLSVNTRYGGASSVKLREYILPS